MDYFVTSKLARLDTVLIATIPGELQELRKEGPED